MGSPFCFVTDPPSELRPFYEARHESDRNQAKAFELLAGGVRIGTGAQHEHRYDRLLAQAGAKGVAVGDIADYLEAFRYGCPPHGGFRIGLARLLMSLLRLPTAKEATMFFRGPNRLRP